MADRIADPSPEEIRQECEAIQATWTPEEERWRRTNPHLEGKRRRQCRSWSQSRHLGAWIRRKVPYVGKIKPTPNRPCSRSDGSLRNPFSHPFNPGDPQPMNPVTACRKYCLECVGWARSEVERCTANKTAPHWPKPCPIYPYRMGTTDKPDKAVLRSIRVFCLDCQGGDVRAVQKCDSAKCSLFPFRFGLPTLRFASEAARREYGSIGQGCPSTSRKTTGAPSFPGNGEAKTPSEAILALPRPIDEEDTGKPIPWAKVRASCVDCMAGNSGSVVWCPNDGIHSTWCSSWPFRFGMEPQRVTERYCPELVDPSAMPDASTSTEDLPRNLPSAVAYFRERSKTPELSPVG